MDTKSDTPRTNAHEAKLQQFRNATRTFSPDIEKAITNAPVSWDDFSRTLERELNTTRETLKATARCLGVRCPMDLLERIGAALTEPDGE